MLREQSEGGGRDAIPPSRTAGENRPARRKFSGKKAARHTAGQVDLKVRRYEVAHPDDRQEYVDQCGFVISWFREMFERVGSGDEVAAGEARVGLRNLLFSGVTKLTALALDKENPSSEWAREVLCDTEVWISKYRDRFGKDYKALRRKLSVVMRNDLWEPESPLYQAVHRELCLCWYYRGEVSFPTAMRYFEELKWPMPAEYESILKLPPLTLESLEKWEELLWMLVKQHNPELRSELAKRYRRVVGRWSQYRTEFGQHLKRVAEAMSS